eukprot:TRINITY_DN15874_c0_g1_i1.p1 TRINITY_DN15874_c0_g1~~TRINITY_DN15874_c0_g1_i1.p1  ORF type:complete len:129 (-),score=34.64 TRINITY_DN15874_c0_g1_i1:139-525(-)
MSEITKQGYLTKEGANVMTWKRRWFCIKKQDLFYSKTPDSPPLGIIPLHLTTGVYESNYKLKELVFEIVTPVRTYYIEASSEKERSEWIAALREVVLQSGGKLVEKPKEKVPDENPLEVKPYMIMPLC